MKLFDLFLTPNSTTDRKYSLYMPGTYLSDSMKGSYRRNSTIRQHENRVMPLSAAQLYTKSPDYDTFRDSLIKMQGNFSFNEKDMIELGEAYFEKYPDNFNSSSPEEIHIGYRIARICLIEQIIKELPLSRKYYYRKMYFKPGEIESIVEHIINKYGKEIISGDYVIINGNLEMLYKKICNLPTSMIKERYTGGISIFYNIAYLLKTAIKKHSDYIM